jgi:hypothetical protein
VQEMLLEEPRFDGFRLLPWEEMGEYYKIVRPDGSELFVTKSAEGHEVYQWANKGSGSKIYPLNMTRILARGEKGVKILQVKLQCEYIDL